MITFPIAKINLGLNVVEKRPDGYHNLETIFYPVPLKDALEVQLMDKAFPSSVDCDLKVTNMVIDGDEQRNLVVKAYQLLKADFPDMPRIHAHLWKGIPSQAGMGGGSSDCAYIVVVRPNIPVSTKEAFSIIHPHRPLQNCREVVSRPVETWNGALVNDFEESVFALYPEIGAIKQQLLNMGATYAAMSGSGSALFGLFKESPIRLGQEFPNMFTFSSLF